MFRSIRIVCRSQECLFDGFWGDADLLSASWNSGRIDWYPNRGGQFALDTLGTAPASLQWGMLEDVLKIDMWHLGRNGDTDEKLVTLELLFEETAGDALSSFEANNLIETLYLYSDDGSGSFEMGTDAPVGAVFSLSLTAGVQTLLLADGDPNLQLTQADAMKTFFLVAEAKSTTSGLAGPAQFRITRLTENGTAEDADHDIPLMVEYGPDVSSSQIAAGCTGNTLQIDAVTTVGKTVTCTAMTSINTSSTVAFTGNSDITFRAPGIGLGNGFRVEAGSRFVVEQ